VGRTIAIGDVHGCIEELIELLDKLQLDSSDRLVFVGDLVDRGPDPVRVVRFVRRLLAARPNTVVLKGNHEDKLCKWRLREAQRLATGRENKMRKPDDVRRAQWEALSEEEVEWLRSLPVYAVLDDNWVAVHAGLVPGVPLEEQEADKVMRVRTLDPVTMKVGQRTDEQEPLEDPPGTVFWASLWKGPYSVVYGHAVNKGPSHGKPVCLELPLVNRGWSDLNEMIACLGIDTGCCFGGRLTAATLGRNGSAQITQVQSRGQYAVLGQTR
jgi:diadenosine tetraphosphatase ApaH/serine/threonine PP2A family protein phosphatase